RACSAANTSGVSCSAGTCANTGCLNNYLDCDTSSSDSNGCETTPSINNCGGCNIVCSANHITPPCSRPVCNRACAPRLAACNNNKQSDGCELAVDSDVNNCGACGVVCRGWQVCRTGKCVPGPLLRTAVVLLRGPNATSPHPYGVHTDYTASIFFAAGNPSSA